MSAVYPSTMVIVESDSPFTVTKEKRTKLPLFRMIGERMFKSHRTDVYPLLDEMATFTSQEQWFFQLLRNNMDFLTNRCIIRNSSLTKSERNRKNVAVKQLINRGLIKKVIKEEYIINPRAIINSKSYESSWDFWNSIP